MTIYKKIHEAKKQIGVISKDAKNPFFKSNYLSLNGLIDAIEEPLNNNGLLLIQPILDGKVRTEIRDIDSDAFVFSEIELTSLNDPQKMGSAITYYRRYTLQSLLGLQADDDDGNLASKAQDRKPSLEANQYQKTLTATTSQIKVVLDKFRMSPEQREVLTNLIK